MGNLNRKRGRMVRHPGPDEHSPRKTRARSARNKGRSPTCAAVAAGKTPASRRGRRVKQLSPRAARRALGNPELAAAKRGRDCAADRCREVARATWYAVVVLAQQFGRSNVPRGGVLQVARQICNCRRSLAEGALGAVLVATPAAMASLISANVTTREPGRSHLRRLSPSLLKIMDGLIQTHLVNPVDPRAAGVSVTAVADLIRKHTAVAVSEMTAWRAMQSLGYHHCKLSRKVRLTSKRKRVIERHVLKHDKALEAEAAGEAVIVYTGESYVRAGHKSTHGWDIR